MAQRPLAALPESLGSTLSTHMVAHNSSGLLGHCTHVDHRHTWKHNIHTHKTIKMLKNIVKKLKRTKYLRTSYDFWVFGRVLTHRSSDLTMGKES